MHVPAIIEVKDHLTKLKANGIISDWELPYENILTRRSAAIFFVEPADETSIQKIAAELAKYDNFSSRDNVEKKLSQMKLRITFSEEEKNKNLANTTKNQ